MARRPRAPVEPEPVGPGEESVWDYPRPPRLEPLAAHVQVIFAGQMLAEADAVQRMLETSHPPTIYLPPDSLDQALLSPSARRSFCEFKGTARYFDVVAGDRRADAAIWCYPEPGPPYEAIAGWYALYPALMDECRVGGARVRPQPGRFYGGWITPGIRGPFKGEPGTEFW